MKLLVIAESLRINNSSSGIVSATYIKMLEKSHDITLMYENSVHVDLSFLSNEVKTIPLTISYNFNSLIAKNTYYNKLYTKLISFNRELHHKIKSYKEAIGRLVKQENFDCIIALGSGASFAPHFALSQLKLNIPYVINIHDPYPLNVYPEPYKTKTNFVFKKLQNKFEKGINKAAFVTLPSQLLKEDLSQYYPQLMDKGVVLPHIGCDLNLKKNPSNAVVTFDVEKINILHAGTLLGPRNPEFLIEAIRSLNTEIPNFESQMQFVFLGNINHKLLAVKDKFKLSNVQFINERVDYNTSLDLMSKADFSLVIEANAAYSPFLPGKVADIVFAEKNMLVLSPLKSEVRNLLGSSYPYQTELNNTDQIKQVLSTIFHQGSAKNQVHKRIIDLKNYVSVEKNCIIMNQSLLKYVK